MTADLVSTKKQKEGLRREIKEEGKREGEKKREKRGEGKRQTGEVQTWDCFILTLIVE